MVVNRISKMGARGGGGGRGGRGGGGAGRGGQIITRLSSGAGKNAVKEYLSLYDEKKKAIYSDNKGEVERINKAMDALRPKMTTDQLYKVMNGLAKRNPFK